MIFGTTGLRRGRSVVEGAVVGAEKDPGFFAEPVLSEAEGLRMTKEAAAARCLLLDGAYAKVSL